MKVEYQSGCYRIIPETNREDDAVRSLVERYSRRIINIPSVPLANQSPLADHTRSKVSSRR